MGNLDRVIERIATGQRGVFSREQVRQAGGTRQATHRRVTAGAWVPLDVPGTLRLASHPRCWEQTCTAALLAAGDGAVLSHRTAATVWGLDGFETGGRVHVTVSRGRTNRLGAVRVHQADVEAADRRLHYGFAVTSPELTLIQLAATHEVSTNALEDAAESAFRLGLTSPERLARHLDRRERAGTRRLRRLLAKRPEGRPRDSKLEMAFLRLVRMAGLADPVPQYEVRVGSNRYFLDWAYPDRRIAIEVDGFDAHSMRAAFEADRARQNELVLAGWTVLRFTRRQILTDAESVLAALLRAAA